MDKTNFSIKKNLTYLKRIGITGGIGSGKTTVCNIFETFGIPVYYADQNAKKLMNSNPYVKKSIKNILGNSAFYKNGQPNKAFIASKIFSDKNLLSQINQIIHPAVQREAERWAEQFNKSIIPYVLNEAALLVENGGYRSLDALIVVTCPEDIRIKRVMKRDSISHAEVMKRIKNQLPEEEKIKVADYLIINDGNLPLIPQIWAIHQKILGVK